MCIRDRYQRRVHGEFNSPVSAEFWIKGFENKRSIPAEEFIEKFANYVFATEHVTLSKIQREWLKKQIDKNEDSFISFQEYDQFFIQIWSFFEQKSEILSLASEDSPSKSKLLMKKEINLNLLYISCPLHYSIEEKKMSFHNYKKFAITPEGLQTDGKTVSKDLKQEDQAITIGNERAANIPDIAFPKEFSDISREHCKIIYKPFNDARKGYYALDFARTPTTFKIQKKPYQLEKDMIITLYGGLMIRISDIYPLRKECWSCQDYYALNVQDNDVELFEKQKQMINEKNNPQIEEKKLEQPKQQEEKKIQQPLKKSTKKITKKVTKQSPSKAAPKPDIPQPFITLQLLEHSTYSIQKTQTFKNELYQKLDADYVISIGQSAQNKFPIANEYLEPFHCQIFYWAKYKSWFVTEQYSGPAFNLQQAESTGTYVCLKSYNEAASKIKSQGQKLEHGMILDLVGHQFKIEINE
eukprot:TRINITY_DN7819_c0_g1_i8.p1 TRINITY_DN7819_c0_g1~~TRINITY_DN7819_c0_g1_i8.p1  ORF type:complete len:469 (-),score=98.92 TRINITY_DN7819_c0_g1_i8:21-1427(-)